MKRTLYRLTFFSTLLIALFCSSCARRVVVADYHRPHHYPHPHDRSTAHTEVIIRP